MLHAVDVSHNGFSEVGQISFAKVAQGQLAQPFRQTEACGFDFIVHQTIGGSVLL